MLLFHQFENNYVFEIRLDYEHNDYVCLTPKLLNKTQPNQSNNLNIETQVSPGQAPGPSSYLGVEMLEIRIKMAATTTTARTTRLVLGGPAASGLCGSSN